MDVAASDSTQIHWSRGLATLLPLILFGQALQAWMSGQLARTFAARKHKRQILMLALLFAANFIGNFYTAMVVLHEKRKRKRVVCRTQRAVLAASGVADAEKENGFLLSIASAGVSMVAGATYSSSKVFLKYI